MKVALVTGANKGIGYAIVRALCKELGESGTVYLASRDEGRGQEAVKQLKEEGLDPKFIQLDILNNDHIEKVRTFLKETHGGLDILVNNAGLAFKKASPEPDSVQAAVTIETNVFATLRLSRALIPLIRSHGRVVNIASRAGSMTYAQISPELRKKFREVDSEQGVVDLMDNYISLVRDGAQAENGWGTWSYGTSKLGLIALTRVQALVISKDTSLDDVLINCCSPGYVSTDLTSHQGPLCTDEGAVTPVYLSLLPHGVLFQGKFFADKSVVDFW